MRRCMAWFLVNLTLSRAMSLLLARSISKKISLLANLLIKTASSRLPPKQFSRSGGRSIRKRALITSRLTAQFALLKDAPTKM